MDAAAMPLEGVSQKRRSLGPDGSAGQNAMDQHFHRARTHWNRDFTALCRRG